MTTEKRVEQEVKAAAKAKGGIALKFVSPGLTGVMDRIVLLPSGIIKFVETKRPGGKLSKRQEYVKKQFEKLGFIVLKIDNLKQAQDEI